MPTPQEIRQMKLMRLYERLRLSTAAKRRSTKQFGYVREVKSQSGKPTTQQWIKAKR